MSRGPPQPRPDYNSHPRWRGPFRVPGRKSRGPPRRCPPRASDPASRARPRVSAGPHRVPRLGLAVVARGSGRRAANPRGTPALRPMGGGRGRDFRRSREGVGARAALGAPRERAWAAQPCARRAPRGALASGSVRPWCPPRARTAPAGASEEIGRVRAEPGTKSSSGRGLPPAFPAAARCHASSLLHLPSDLLFL